MPPSRSPFIVAGVVVAMLVAGCGSDDDDGGAVSIADTGSDSVPDSTPSAKPTVSIPAELPTELVITDLTTGTGPEAAEGDTVVVHYVGVLSKDGTEFDNSYDDGVPFPVTLGSTGVIEGWQQGLIGAQAGGRRQLDIPAELGYGDEGRGELIKPGDALTFVLDVRTIIPSPDPASAPTDVSVPLSEGAETVKITVLEEGNGEAIGPGVTAVLNIVLYPGTGGEPLANSWDANQPIQVILDESSTLPGIVQAVIGMSPGERRLAIIPAALAFADQGNDELGIAPNTDVVMIIDLLGAY